MWVARRLSAPKLRRLEGGAKRRCVVPTIEFIANAIGRPKRVEAPDGGDLLDICDETIAPIPFSCRSATCGTCHVEVLEGADLLEPSSAREAELLDLLGGDNTRLACQARVRPGPGLLRLRAVLGG
jgi:ferredoxin